jgi:excisionase family DNA binding protein
MGKTYSTFAIAEMLSVDPGSVANWIDQNLLKAHRTPGGHRRVTQDDLLIFLRKHKMPIPPEFGRQTIRVLVVDDEPAITRMISQAIRSAHPDYEVMEAHDGFNAGASLESFKPSLVVLDLRMPGMNGRDVCRLIKSREQTKHIEVLAMTAYPSQDAEADVIKCGARVCLTKPLKMDELLRHIETLV